MATIRYNKVIINFIYSFSWDVLNSDFEELVKKAEKVKTKIDTEKWQQLYLHDRNVSWLNADEQASYQPNIFSQNLLVLNKSFLIDSEADVIIPTNNAVLTEEIIPAIINGVVRLYENGCGNCILSFEINQDPCYKKLQYLMHLASGVSHSNINSQTDSNNKNHKTQTYLKNKRETNAFYPSTEYINISLNDLFNNIYEKVINTDLWKAGKKPFDQEAIQRDDVQFTNIQVPYTLTIAEINDEDFKQFENQPTREKIKELGSIALRLNSDNSKIETEYDFLKREYVYNALGYLNVLNEKRNDKNELQCENSIRLKNYSHHSNLFYTIGKRGALAVTSDLKNNPSFFVLPTLANLVEILRSRWHLGTIVNLKLDESLEKIAKLNSSRNTKILLEDILDDIYECRTLFGFFLQNPTPYLFDGGAITDIAEAGENLFWLKHLSDVTEKKFNVIDSLIKDKREQEKLKSLANYYKANK